MKKSDNNQIEIIDFRSRTDRTIYILQYEEKGYVVVNNDPGMNEDSRAVYGKGRRENLVARLIPENWRKHIIKDEIEVQGFEYDSRLSVVDGKIQANNMNSYSTINIDPVERSQIKNIVNSIDRVILESLEHFLVPKNIADKMRAYASKYISK